MTAGPPTVAGAILTTSGGGIRCRRIAGRHPVDPIDPPAYGIDLMRRDDGEMGRW